MTNNQKGNIGEAKAILYFSNEGYNIFTPFGVACPFDLVVYKDNILKRVLVKTTTSLTESGKYEFKIVQNSRKGQIHFDSESCDLLFLYNIPEDKITILDAKEVKSKTSISI